MPNFSIPLSGLTAESTALSTIANNLSNQNTPGYFDLASKQRVIQHFYNNLVPHGYLFLGHSESLFGVNGDFRLVHLPGTTAYVKGERSRTGKAGI